MSQYNWIPCDPSNIPMNAVRGGTDSDGSGIYVGRAFHEGDWIPAKVIPEKNISYIAYDGKEHMKDSCEILCEQRFEWVPTSGDNVPSNAVAGGKTSDGETLYVGRVNHEGSHTVGKVHKSHGCCYIPYDGEELSFTDYEILILQ